jgi:hypothetical protein
VDQKEILAYQKIIDQNRIFCLPKTILVDQEKISALNNYSEFSIKPI